jgi:hypothetical protein
MGNNMDRSLKRFDRLSQEENGLALSDNIVGLFDDKIIVEFDDEEIESLIDTYAVSQSLRTS